MGRMTAEMDTLADLHRDALGARHAAEDAERRRNEYAARLVEADAATPTEIAHRLGVHRPHVYRWLERVASHTGT